MHRNQKIFSIYKTKLRKKQKQRDFSLNLSRKQDQKYNLYNRKK